MRCGTNSSAPHFLRLLNALSLTVGGGILYHEKNTCYAADVTKERINMLNIPFLLENLSLEEKAALCSGHGFWWTEAVERLGLPSIMMSDGPHGLRKQAKESDHVGLNDSIPAVCFPSGAALAASFDREARYGRLIMKNGELERIVEYKDATEEERAVKFCNSGMMCFDGKKMFEILDAIDNNNAAGEYYLTDAVAIALKKGWKCSAVECSVYEASAANTREELALLEHLLQERNGKKSA